MTQSTQSTQGALSEHSESTQKAFRGTKLVREKSYFVIPSEPKILRLVDLVVLL